MKEFPVEYCCICVERREELQNIEVVDADSLTHLEKLLECLPRVEWNLNFSLCLACVEKLNSTLGFLRQCVRSETLRQEKMKRMEAEESRFECDACGKCFKLSRFLKSHITRIHSRAVQIETTETEKDVAVAAAIGEEDNNENDADIINSDTCWSGDDGDVMNPAEAVTNKKRAKATGGKKRGPKKRDPLNCEYCGKLFQRRQHWSAHIRANHTFERPYACGECGAAFVNSHSLLVHRRKHRGERPYVCTACGKTFVCSGDLYHHAKIHADRREYACDLCAKRFNTTSILRTHKIVKHTAPADWRYECGECARRFPIRSSLQAHAVRHSGVRAHACHVCAKGFFSRSELGKHVASHGADRLHRCDACAGQRHYKSREGLRRHVLAAHGGAARPAAAAAPAPQ